MAPTFFLDPSDVPEHRDTIFIALALAEVLLEQSKIDSAQNIVDEVITSAGLESVMAAKDEMLARLGEDKPIGSDIPHKLNSLIISSKKPEIITASLS